MSVTTWARVRALLRDDSAASRGWNAQAASPNRIAVSHTNSRSIAVLRRFASAAAGSFQDGRLIDPPRDNIRRVVRQPFAVAQRLRRLSAYPRYRLHGTDRAAIASRKPGDANGTGIRWHGDRGSAGMIE